MERVLNRQGLLQRFSVFRHKSSLTRRFQMPNAVSHLVVSPTSVTTWTTTRANMTWISVSSGKPRSMNLARWPTLRHSHQQMSWLPCKPLIPCPLRTKWMPRSKTYSGQAGIGATKPSARSSTEPLLKALRIRNGIREHIPLFGRRPVERLTRDHFWGYIQTHSRRRHRC